MDQKKKVLIKIKGQKEKKNVEKRNERKGSPCRNLPPCFAIEDKSVSYRANVQFLFWLFVFFYLFFVGEMYRCEFISLVKVIAVVCVCDENKEQSLVEQTIARGLRVESTLNTRRIDRVLCWWHGVCSAARSETSSLRDEWVKGTATEEKRNRKEKKEREQK